MSNICEESIRSYFFMTPNIIFDLGLDIYEISLYTLLKKIAGEKGHSIYSNKKLAEMLKIGITKLKEIKKKLSSIWPLINRPLILVTPRKTELGDCDTDDIKIINIWDVNDKHFKDKSKGPSPDDGGVNRQKTEGGSPRDHKEEPLKKTKIKEEREKEVGSACVASPTKKERETPVPKVNVAQPTQSAICSSSFPFDNKEREKVYHALEARGIDRSKIEHIASYAYKDLFWKARCMSSALFIKHFDTMTSQAPKMLSEMDNDEQVKYLVKEMHGLYALTKQSLHAGDGYVYEQSYQRCYDFSLGYHEIKRRLLELYE